MQPREIRRRSKSAVRALDLPTPFSVHALCANVAASRDRPIDLCPLVMPPDSPSGVWAATPKRDYIFYEKDTTPLHQALIVSHELGHILFEHGTDDLRPGHGCSDQTAMSILGAAQLVLPDLDIQVISRLLNRTGYAYSADEESLAETFATTVVEEVNRLQPIPEWEAPAHAADIRNRVHRTIESGLGRRQR
jgi:hypothetical protein